MTVGEQILHALNGQRELLAGILAELQSWREPSAPATECPHPDEARQDLSSMGHHWVRCRACRTDIEGGPER